MTDQYILTLSASQADLDTVGGKGASLARLARAGFPVPSGFHVSTQAYRRFIDHNQLQGGISSALDSVDVSRPQSLETASQAIAALFAAATIPGDIASAVVHAYVALSGTNPAVAVRSSATAEDLPEASFAGQQETYLNVQGADAVLEATRKCWSSLWTARAIGYRARQDIPADRVALAVVVQMLVSAEAAGIMFTANPVNGHRDQVVISASWGLGEAVVGGMVTPDNLTLEKASGRLLDRVTAHKTVQTVRVNSGTEQQPLPESMRDVPVLSDSQAAELARLGVQIEQLYHMPMDIEWALADGQFAIVQARPITALPEPEAPVPDSWPMPDPKGRYMRVSIVELLPDPVTPLFETLGMPAINRGIGVLCKELMNMPYEDFLTGFIMTINGYGYEQVSFTPKQWWLLLSRMVPAFPHMLREGVPYWQDIAHPHYVKTAAHWSEKYLPGLSAIEIFRGIEEVLEAFAWHLASLMGSTMGPAAGSEGLFTGVYQRLVMKEGDPEPPAFLMGFDNIPLRGEKMLYDLANWCRENDTLSAYLAETPVEDLTRKLSGPVAPEGIDIKLWDEWQRRFRAYLDQFGYAIYDMDFAKPLPMDEPEPILEMLKMFLAGKAKNPYERQGYYAQRREQAMQSVMPRLKGFKRWAFAKALNWAQKLAPLREDGLSEIGLGYPVLRRMLRELGRRLADAGVITQPDDIYWLEGSEVEALAKALDSGDVHEYLVGVVQERQSIWRARKRLTPPSQLPPDKKRYMGIDMEAHLAGGLGGLKGDTIKGVPTSPGQATGTARVLHGSEDFDQMQPGDILVAGITTPAWTPLFAMAAGVVTDIGGPLSHGSIVAREYGIPAVLGTGVATRVIRSGQKVTIDGRAGTVTILNHEPAG